MRIPFKFWASHAIALLLGVCIANGNAVGADKLHWVVTNDDVPPSLTNSASFFAVGTGGQLTLKNKVLLGSVGIAGGYFAANRVAVPNSENAQCVYASVAQTGTILGIVLKTLVVGGTATGSKQELM